MVSILGAGGPPSGSVPLRARLAAATASLLRPALTTTHDTVCSHSASHRLFLLRNSEILGP